jgi:hypothetical protein
MTGTDTTGQSPAGTAPFLDLARLVAGIRWRRRTWMSLALAGLFLGALFTVLSPPRPTAVTSLLVTHSNDQKADWDVLMMTDVAFCQTSEVAGAALKELNLNERTGDFLATYQCTSVAANILKITVTGASEPDAARRARVLAEAFIANHLKRTQDAADAQANTLLDRRARLERTLAMLNTTISSATSPAQLEALYTARAGITSQILDLARQAEDARVGIPVVTAGTRVVDQARAVPARVIRTAVTNTGTGLLLGLGLGLAVAAVASVAQDRPVLRRDIAAELGVSVVAQLPRPPWGPRRLWCYSRHVRDRQRVAETLARVVRSARGSMSLLEMGCPGVAAELALDIAARLTPESPVVIITGLHRGDLRETARRSGNPARIVDLADPSPEEPARDRSPELSLGVGSVGPGTSWADLPRLGTETLLIVRAGHATTLGLHTIARQLVYSEISATGVVLVHPDPKDRSDGTLWDGLHTVLRERSATNGRASMPGWSPVRSGNGPTVLEPSSTPDEE